MDCLLRISTAPHEREKLKSESKSRELQIIDARLTISFPTNLNFVLNPIALAIVHEKSH